MIVMLTNICLTSHLARTCSVRPATIVGTHDIGQPTELRQQIVQHMPMHSTLVQREAEQFDYPYMVGDF